MTEEESKSYIERVLKAAEEFNRKYAEYEHEMIIKACSENDFVVPSKEYKEKLEQILPKDTRIIVSPYIDCVLMMKKCVLEQANKVPEPIFDFEEGE